MCIEQSGFKSILCEDELVVEDIKYSNTINLLTSVETILYGGEIHLWIPKKLNIFRGYVDKPDIWSFFLGEDERDFLVQQTATSPEINNIAMTTNSDIIGGSFYEENSEGAFFINCRKHEGEIKFTLDKISDYSLDIVNVMQVSGYIPNFETVNLFPVDKNLIIVAGLDNDGNLYVGIFNHSKDYADLEIKGYVPSVDSFSSVMLVDSRVIVVGNNDNGNSIWYEYYDSRLRKIYESYERISSMAPYKSSILAIADNDRVLYLESFDKWVFEQLPMDGLPEDSDLSGWKIIKSDYPTIMSMESSEKDAFFAYKLNKTDRWERIECLNTP